MLKNVNNLYHIEGDNNEDIQINAITITINARRTVDQVP